MNSNQLQTIVAEVRAIEAQATKTAILVADEVAQLRVALDAAIASGEVSTDFLKGLSAQLFIQERAVLAAISAANLSARITNGDLAPSEGI
jgi:hypothetical protein